MLGEFLSTADVSSRHQIEIRGSAAEVYAALLRLDLGTSLLIGVLFRLRGLSREMHTFAGLQKHGFTPLAQVEDSRIVMGIAGQFWTPSGRVQHLDAEEFKHFDRPGWAKAVWGFAIEVVDPGRVALVTETRVRCYGDAARRRFKRYWFLVGPFSGVIRREILRLVRQTVER